MYALRVIVRTWLFFSTNGKLIFLLNKLTLHRAEKCPRVLENLLLKHLARLDLHFIAMLTSADHLEILAQPYLNSSSTGEEEGEISLETFPNVNLPCQQLPCYMFLRKIHMFHNLGTCCEIWKLWAASVLKYTNILSDTKSLKSK